MYLGVYIPLIIPVQLGRPFKVDILSTEHSNRVLTTVKSLPPTSQQTYTSRCPSFQVKLKRGAKGSICSS